MRIGLGCGDSHNMEKLVQEDIHQETIEVDISSFVVSSGNHEVQETYRDTHDVVGTPRKSMRQRRESSNFNDYVALVNQLVDSKPSSYQEATQHQVWKDTMVEKSL